MTCTPTIDADATWLRCARSWTPGAISCVSPFLPQMRSSPSGGSAPESPVPIVADIHFDYRLAIGAVRAGAAKLRINPGTSVIGIAWTP